MVTVYICDAVRRKISKRSKIDFLIMSVLQLVSKLAFWIVEIRKILHAIFYMKKDLLIGRSDRLSSPVYHLCIYGYRVCATLGISGLLSWGKAQSSRRKAFPQALYWFERDFWFQQVCLDPSQESCTTSLKDFAIFPPHQKKKQ